MFNLSQLSQKTALIQSQPLDGNPSRHSKNPTSDKEKTSSFRIDDILIKTKPASSSTTAEIAELASRAHGSMYSPTNNTQHVANNPLFAQLSSMYNCFSPMSPNKGLHTQHAPLTPDIISMLYGNYF